MTETRCVILYAHINYWRWCVITYKVCVRRVKNKEFQIDCISKPTSQLCLRSTNMGCVFMLCTEFAYRHDSQMQTGAGTIIISVCSAPLETTPLSFTINFRCFIGRFSVFIGGNTRLNIKNMNVSSHETFFTFYFCWSSAECSWEEIKMSPNESANEHARRGRHCIFFLGSWLVVSRQMRAVYAFAAGLVV